MPTAPLQPVPSQPRWRRRLVWGLGGLLVLELLYNTVLLTGLLATVINHFAKGRPQNASSWYQEKTGAPKE